MAKSRFLRIFAAAVSPGFTVSGERANTFDNNYFAGTAINRTAALQSNNSCLVSGTGAIQVAYHATITHANGKSSTVSENATITLTDRRRCTSTWTEYTSVDMITQKTP